MSLKNQAKNIAIKVIQEISSCKHFSEDHLMILIKDYTNEPKLKKETLSQCRRALYKLGYIDAHAAEILRNQR